MPILAILAAVAGALWVLSQGSGLVVSDASISDGSGDGSGSVDPSANDFPTLDASGQGSGYTVNSKVLAMPSGVQSTIEKYAAAYGVDPNLAKAQAYAESGGDQTRISPVGAVGVFQLMPKTAAGLGVDPYSQEQNIQGGVKYLGQLLTKYNGDQTLALAAYNAGMGNVSKFGGVPPFAETQNYIKKILGLMA